MSVVHEALASARLDGETVAIPEAKERPILFSGPMVRAILGGRKTQTRRVVKGLDPNGGDVESIFRNEWFQWVGGDCRESFECPYGKPGDRLYVRETWANFALPGYSPVYCYRADDEMKPPGVAWRPSIHMPRFVSRLLLEVTAVRVERLQDITEDDATAEGIDDELAMMTDGLPGPHRLAYAELWDQLNAKRGFGWDVNPWVWVVEIKRVQEPSHA